MAVTCGSVVKHVNECDARPRLHMKHELHVVSLSVVIEARSTTDQRDTFVTKWEPTTFCDCDITGHSLYS